MVMVSEQKQQKMETIEQIKQDWSFFQLTTENHLQFYKISILENWCSFEKRCFVIVILNLEADLRGRILRKNFLG